MHIAEVHDISFAIQKYGRVYMRRNGTALAHDPLSLALIARNDDDVSHVNAKRRRLVEDMT